MRTDHLVGHGRCVGVCIEVRGDWGRGGVCFRIIVILEAKDMSDGVLREWGSLNELKR